MEGRICLSGLARQVSVLGAAKGPAVTTSVVAVRNGAKRPNTARRGAKNEEDWLKARQERAVGRELSSKERERTGRTQQVPLEGTSVIKTRSQHLQEYGI